MISKASGSIKPTVMTQTLAGIAGESAVNGGTAFPCDDDGRPRRT